MSLNSDKQISGDFFDLLKRSGYRFQEGLENVPNSAANNLTHGTTVLAFHFKDGVLVAGDRRATAGNAIMYERCDKVISIDDYSLMAIAGTPATAFEMARHPDWVVGKRKRVTLDLEEGVHEVGVRLVAPVSSTCLLRIRSLDAVIED